MLIIVLQENLAFFGGLLGNKALILQQNIYLKPHVTSQTQPKTNTIIYSILY